jgi:hypothetical protein
LIALPAVIGHPPALAAPQQAPVYRVRRRARGFEARAVPGREIVLLAALIAACIAVALGSLVFELE